MMLGKTCELRTETGIAAHSDTAQQCGIGMGLSIAGAVFVNKALQNLREVVPNVTSSELQSAILGVSGNSLDTLPKATKEAALTAIVTALQSV